MGGGLNRSTVPPPGCFVSGVSSRGGSIFAEVGFLSQDQGLVGDCWLLLEMISLAYEWVEGLQFTMGSRGALVGLGSRV